MIAPVVDAAWTAAHRDDVVLADVRWYLDGRPGRAATSAGTCPARSSSSSTSGSRRRRARRPGGTRCPTPEVFARGWRSWASATATPSWPTTTRAGRAARLVWMLRVTGRDAALLDGGIAAWDGPLETAPVVRPRASFTPRPWPAGAWRAPTTRPTRANAVIDARPRERYPGGARPGRPAPRARPRRAQPAGREHVGDDGRLLDRELRERFAAAGVDGARSVVSYCGSGVTACHNLVVLEHLGLGPGRLYPGSWSQWANDPERPAETGEGA